MWALSRKAALGSLTWARAIFASPGLAVRLAIRVGWEVRLVLPFSCRESLGLKGREEHSPTWKRWLSGVLWSSAEVRVPVIANGSQLVGLRVKSGRSSFSATERT